MTIISWFSRGIICFDVNCFSGLYGSTLFLAFISKRRDIFFVVTVVVHLLGW
jgi:hypothetical protein